LEEEDGAVRGLGVSDGGDSGEAGGDLDAVAAAGVAVAAPVGDGPVGGGSGPWGEPPVQPCSRRWVSEALPPPRPSLPRSPYAREAATDHRVDVTGIPLTRPYYRAAEKHRLQGERRLASVLALEGVDCGSSLKSWAV
jgi:hypothetical protein